MSQLTLTRRLLALRKAYPAIRLGAMEHCRAEGDLLIFERIHGSERVLCLFNLSCDAVAPPEPFAGTPIMAINEATAAVLPGFGALYLTM